MHGMDETDVLKRLVGTHHVVVAGDERHFAGLAPSGPYFVADEEELPSRRFRPVGCWRPRAEHAETGRRSVPIENGHIAVACDAHACKLLGTLSHFRAWNGFELGARRNLAHALLSAASPACSTLRAVSNLSNVSAIASR